MPKFIVTKETSVYLILEVTAENEQAALKAFEHKDPTLSPSGNSLYCDTLDVTLEASEDTENDFITIEQIED